jgi:hypothetical protein
VVKPYPIATQLMVKEGAPPMAGRILRVNQQGFMFQFEGVTPLKLGEKIFCNFTLPVLGTLIVAQVKVIKTYLQWADVSSTEKVKIQRLELHFINASSVQLKKILEFTTKIKQKD